VVLEGNMVIFRPSHSCGRILSHFSTVYLCLVGRSVETTCLTLLPSSKHLVYPIFVVATAMLIYIPVFWDMIPC
jgi:hypothetical protein